MLGKLFPSLSNLFSPSKEAASALPIIPLPKVPNKQQAQASFSRRTKTASGDQRLVSADRQTANLDLTTLRNGTSTKSTIHDLAQVSPDLSASVWAYQRLVVTKGFSAIARNQDGTASAAATATLQQILARMNYMTDYSQGFSNIAGIHAVAESLTKELRMYGACSMELVLDKARLPSYFQPISTTQLVMWDAKDGTIYPQQEINGNYIVLDQPTFFYTSIDQDLLSAYSDSPMEAALASTLADAEFTQDVRRVIKRSLHPRMDAEIDSDLFRKSIPQELMGDAESLRAYQNNYISAIEETVNGLEPDDALVHFDAIKFNYLNNGNVTLNKEYEVLQAMINSKLATGTKAPAAVLGHGSGSANIASAEIQLFLKYATGMQLKINAIMSRAFTLALRLMGEDVYVQFEFDEIDLRPASELEAFRAMHQSRILEQLSLGLISDEEACIALTGKLPPSGYKSLTGTFFKAGSTDPNAVDTASAQSNTGALQQSLTSDAPKAPKGPVKAEAPAQKPEAPAPVRSTRSETDGLLTKVAELEKSQVSLSMQCIELEKQQYIMANKRPVVDPVQQTLAVVLASMSAPKPEPQALNVHVHMPEGLVQMATPAQPNIQVDVHVPEAAAQPASNIQVDVHVPQQAPAPVSVNVTNDVQPAPVTVNNAFSSKAVQTVQRDSKDEIVSTTTDYS